MYRPNEWDSIGSFYDHSWGQLNKAGELSGFVRVVSQYLLLD